jgi:3-oxoadipate enol-lactonase
LIGLQWHILLSFRRRNNHNETCREIDVIFAVTWEDLQVPGAVSDDGASPPSSPIPGASCTMARPATRAINTGCSNPNPAIIEFSTETITMPMIQVDGLQVEYTQTGAGVDLLLLHSLLTELSVFEQVLPALAASHRVTCINLPGFGASGPAEFATVADYADHVARAMDALKLPATTDVFGNGFGAFVALELAIRHGARFGRLLVADTVAAFPEPARLPFHGMAEKVRANGMQAVLDTAIGRMFPAEFQGAHPEVVARRKSILAPANAECFARACLALAALDLRPKLGGIRNPTLVMCGALDQTTPPALAQEVAKAIPGARYREIAGSGHCPMLEQPDALVAAMSAFLGSGA